MIAHPAYKVFSGLTLSIRAGELQRYHIVCCGRCRQVALIGFAQLRESEKILRAERWVKTASHGWICRDCQARMRQEIDDLRSVPLGQV